MLTVITPQASQIPLPQHKNYFHHSNNHGHLLHHFP